LRWRLVLLVALAGLFAACSLTDLPSLRGRIIDSWTLGDRVDCAGGGQEGCDHLVRLATERLAQKYPDHADIESVGIFSEVLAPGTARSGSMRIVAFGLVDDSGHAVGVYCGVGIYEDCTAEFDAP
jgi:hypothetical protein